MNEIDINDKKVVTANEMIGELIKNIVVFGIVFFLIYRFIYSAVAIKFGEYDNRIILAFLVIILHTFLISLTLKIANKRSFKNYVIYKKDVSKVIKTISFIIFFMLLLQVIAVLSSVNSAIDTAVNESVQLSIHEHLIPYIYDDNEMKEYQIEKENAIKRVKTEMYTYLTIVETGICIVYGSAMIIERKVLYKRAIEKAVG